MAAVSAFTAAGEIKALTSILTNENMTLKLFTAIATAGGLPTVGTVIGDLTEAAFTGYAAKTLTGTISGSTWSTPSGTPATSQYNAAAPQSFTATGSYQTVLGAHYIGVTSGILYETETFVSPVVLSSGNPTFTFIPTLKLGTAPAPTS